MKLRRKNKYAVGQIIGAGMQLGDMIGTPIRNKAEQIDPTTGEYIDFNKAQRNAWAGSFWSPLKAATAEGATTGERIAGALGFGAAFQGNRLRRLEKQRKEQIWNMRNPSVQGTSYNPYYMAGGGISGEYAELEDGEPFMTPDGNIEMVNGRTHAEGGEDYVLPTGTAILGKNISKRYGERFKELGAKLKKAQDKHQKNMTNNANPIARRTSMLMLDRIEKQYADLVQEQELAKLGSTKGGKYPGGGTIKGDINNDGVVSLGESRQYYNDLIREQQNNPVLPRQVFNAETPQDVSYLKNTLAAKWNPIANNQSIIYRPGLDVIAMKPNESTETPTEYARGGRTKGGYDPYFNPYQLGVSRPGNFGLDKSYQINAVKMPTQNTNPTYAKQGVSKPYIPEVQGAEPQLDWSGLRETSRMNPIQPRGGVFNTNTPTANLGGGVSMQPMNTIQPQTSNNSFGSTMTTLGQLAPIAYNLGQGLFGKPDVYDYRQYTNPYIGNIRSLMRNRRYNVQPELEANKIAQSVYNRNLSQAGASPSQLYAGLQAGTVGRQRADAAALANQQNVNNQYIGQQAEMDYNLGRDISGLKQYGYEANLRNRAALRNYLSTGLSQVQQYAQVQELMKNQKLRDKERLALLKDILPNYLYKEYEGYLFNHNNN